jgi:trehalose 6-phosphate synthase/phosphatase
MSQVIIVSNRLPVSVKKDNGRLEFYPSLGGLATGLSSYVDDPRNLWIGWPGIASEELTNDEKQQVVAELAKHNCRPVFLNKRQVEDFYNGYSNSVLWPTFHNMRRQTKDAATLKRWWQSYRSVNQQFAQAALNVAETGSRIWIHDYQLLLVPELMRAERSDVTTGFFLHIPFPPAKVISKLPEYKKLLSGMLGADLIGFHIADYTADFLATAQAAGLGVAGIDQFAIGNRVVRIGEFPMGIDYTRYSQAGRSKLVKAAVRKYRKRYKKMRVIVAVDRLDPTKGLVERLKAYRTLLERHPNLRGKVVFSMVAAPSRTEVAAYQHLAKRLGALAQEINATYGTPKWQPVDYLNVSLPFEDVAGLFQVADVAFITPLKDGMNLVAKEFVASAHKNGVLILSETAGAAQELKDALLVDPKRPETMVNALEQALKMRRRELRRRLRRMKLTLSTYTVQEWAKDFVVSLQQPVPGTKPRTRTVTPKLELQLRKDYAMARRRLLLLDYDGSLVPFTNNFQAAKPPKSLLQLLETLSAARANDVVLISGRSASDLENWFGNLHISLVAEHGAAVKKIGNKTWQMIEKTGTGWKHLLKPALDKYAKLTPGARVEVKPHSLAWHYRGAPPYYAQKYAVIIKRVLKPFLKSYGLELLQGNKVLEIKNPRISKGVAAGRWLKRDYDFMLSIGDDVTDEDLFAVLPAHAYSLKVGRGRTHAKYRVHDHRATVNLLRKLTKSP